MANQRQGVPAGWTWRDGRPRWIPSPTLRKAGWKGADLKDPTTKHWLARGPSITAAEAVMTAVSEWRAGGLVPHHLAGSAPAGACERPGAGQRATVEDRRAIGALLDSYMGDPKLKLPASREWEKLAVSTQRDRRSKLSRLIDVMAGYTIKPKPGATVAELAAYADARALVRAMSIDVLAPPDFADVLATQDVRGPLDDIYWKLADKVGLHMAPAVLAETSAWLEWCRKRRAITFNWATLVDRSTPPGRIRVGTWEELSALIKAAETMGLHSIADAIILGVDLSWSQADRLKMKWPQIDGDGKVSGTRQKTGRKGKTPLLPILGLPRVKAISARQEARYGKNVKPTHVLVCEDTDEPWKPDWYRHRFNDVRQLAAKDCPSVLTLRDADLRDTAITVGKAAGLSNEEIASRSFHSMKRIADVLDKHYVELGQEIADAGATKLNDYLTARGIAL